MEWLDQLKTSSHFGEGRILEGDKTLLENGKQKSL